ncbi:MAG TPA: helix-turn-helix domain-containing protein [Candidatus Sulfotelmatobacter sp.]
MTLTPSLISILEIHNLSSGAKQALLGLLSFRNRQTGRCCPKIATLRMRLGGISDATVRRWLRELRLAGIVRASRHRCSNSYDFEFSTNCGKQTVDSCGKANRDRSNMTGQDRSNMSGALEPIVLNYVKECGGGDNYEATPPPLEIPKQRQKPTPKTPVERKPPARAQTSEPDESETAVVRQSLHALAQQAHLPPPDDGLVRLVIEAARGATGEQINAVLVALWKSGQLAKMRGWGFVPIKIGDCFGRRATA